MRQSTDGFAVAAFHGAAVAGFYNLAKRTRLALQIGLTSAVGRVSLPTFAHVRDDPARLSSALEQAMRLTAFVCFPIFIGVAAVAPELVAVFLGGAWAPAAAPMSLLMISGALAIITRLNENLLLTLGRRWITVLLNAGALTLLAILVFSFGRHGPVTIAAVVTLEGVIHNTVTWYVTGRCAHGVKLRAYLESVWAPMAICLAMLLLIGALRENGLGEWLPTPVRLILFVAIGAAFYSALAWAAARPAVRAFVSAVRTILPSLRPRSAS
jgi:O-antigen/teichoic acid export membrane protein